MRLGSNERSRAIKYKTAEDIKARVGLTSAHARGGDRGNERAPPLTNGGCSGGKGEREKACRITSTTGYLAEKS